MAPRIICLDTNIMILLFCNMRPGQKNLEEQAASLLDLIKKNKDIVVLPADVLAELYSCIPDNAIAEFQKTMTAQFRIAPFDQLAALYYREIYREQRPSLCDLAKDGYLRCNQTADIRILATARSVGASIIYSEDKWFLNMAQNYLQVSPMPPCPPRQLMLSEAMSSTVTHEHS